MNSTETTTSSEQAFAETMFGVGHAKPKETIRPLPRRAFVYTQDDYGQAVNDQIELEINEGIERIREACRKEKKKPKGSDTHAVRLAVLEKHHRIMLDYRMKVELWSQSERILNILRAKGNYPEQQDRPLPEVLAKFINKLNPSEFPELDPCSPLYIGPEGKQQEALLHRYELHLYDPRGERGLSLNSYFSKLYPHQVRDYGFPFFTSIKGADLDSAQKNPRNEQLKGINTLFFAALLGGDRRLGHDVVCYVPEARFYFWDPLVSKYIPTTEAKMRLYLLQVLQRLVWGQDVDDAKMILEVFCAPKILETIIDQSKALLAAERGYFEGPRSCPRLTMENQTTGDIASTVQSFVQMQIKNDDSSILTITECMAEVKDCLNQAGARLPGSREIKTIVESNIRAIHGKGLRNDLVLADKKCVIGWKGIRIIRQALTPDQELEVAPERNDSGDSDHSEQTSHLQALPEGNAEVALLS